MISFIKGTVADSGSGNIVIETAGIGYLVTVPDSPDYVMISTGDEIKIWTYLSVSQDALNLYGFLTKEESELFKMLITVSGIGPKGAVGILSGLSVEELKYAIITEDVKTISSAPGIGKKTAGKLILELKDKFDKNAVLAGTVRADAGSDDVSIAGTAHNEAVQALTALGYSAAEAMRAVSTVKGEDLTVEEILRMALMAL